MSGTIIFFFGILIGSIGTYLVIRNRQKRKQHGVTSYVEKQQNEKQSRKDKILEMIRKKGSVTNNYVESALGVSDASTTNYLSELEREGKIEQIGYKGRYVSYQINKKF